jgi:UDP-N-acetylmuramoylalanine--D-glutamate ligase
MIPAAWRAGEVAVIGLGKSGRSVAALLRREGIRVYVSDAGQGPGLDEAAAQLRALGAEVDVGGHDLARIAKASLVVASPGVPPTAPPLAAARAANIPVVGEIEIALHFLPNTQSIAVTGTNGKTTTTALIGHLLRTLGEDAVDAGNIGTPLAELALREKPPRWTALELSSFQLHDTPSIRPDVGVVTNLGPDHLDRYASADDYYADKARLMANADAGSKWVLNADDPEVLALHRRLPGMGKAGKLNGQQWTFSLKDRNAAAWYDRERDMLMALGAPLLPRKELALFGDHNVANTLAAALAVMVGDRGKQNPRARMAIAAGIRNFRALKHRLEVAGEPGGVLWINDSKATNVGSTLVAVQGMTRPTILLLGGRHKGEPYTALAEPLRRIGKTVLAYGESAPIIEQDLAGVVPLERLGSSFPDVIARARALASPGDVVLLSPACSSYDMFNNYEERGAEFKRLALATT